MDLLRESLWKQFGATIDMLRNAILAWPGESLENNKRFFYIIYHTLIFLNYYLTVPAGPFSSPLSFTLTNEDEIPAEALDDIVPDKIYNKQELLDYLQLSREKCRQLISELTEEKAAERWIEVNSHRNYSVLELLMYNMRHVQHHTAQLNLMLRQTIGDAPGWVSRAKD